MLGIPNPIAYTCTNCGEPAVVAEFPTGLYPVHCGTYRYTCPATHRRGLELSDRQWRTVSSPPPSAASLTEPRRPLRRRMRVWLSRTDRAA